MTGQSDTERAASVDAANIALDSHLDRQAQIAALSEKMKKDSVKHFTRPEGTQPPRKWSVGLEDPNEVVEDDPAVKVEEEDVVVKPPAEEPAVVEVVSTKAERTPRVQRDGPGDAAPKPI